MLDLDRACELELRSVIAYAQIENAASRRIMEKLGLSYERSSSIAASPACCTASSSRLDLSA